MNMHSFVPSPWSSRAATPPRLVNVSPLVPWRGVAFSNTVTNPPPPLRHCTVDVDDRTGREQRASRGRLANQLRAPVQESAPHKARAYPLGRHRHAPQRAPIHLPGWRSALHHHDCRRRCHGQPRRTRLARPSASGVRSQRDPSPARRSQAHTPASPPRRLFQRLDFDTPLNLDMSFLKPRGSPAISSSSHQQRLLIISWELPRSPHAQVTRLHPPPMQASSHATGSWKQFCVDAVSRRLVPSRCVSH